MRSRKAIEEDFASSYFYEDSQRKILLEAVLDVRDLLSAPKIKSLEGTFLEVTDVNGKLVQRYRLTGVS